MRSNRSSARPVAEAIVHPFCSGEEHMKSLIVRFVREDAGQDLIEYALLAGFISLVAVVAITAVGTGVNTVYQNIDTQVGAIPAGTGS